MLPTPVPFSVSSRPRRFWHIQNSSNRNGGFLSIRGFSLGRRDVWVQRIRLSTRKLLSRSRVTNLGIALLLSLLLFSIYLNLRYWLYSSSTLYLAWNAKSTWNSNSGVPPSIESTVLRSPSLHALEHLIIVPGHGVWLGKGQEEVFDEGTWVLEAYPNRSEGESGTEAKRMRIRSFVEHIQRGVELANRDEKSLLVFSGGATRPSTPLSESTSYFSLALALSLLSPPYSSAHTTTLTIYERTTTEPYALDSYQNLLFSLARFRIVTGHYPSRVTVVGYQFKERRFTRLHRSAVRWPLESKKWRYVGIDFEEGDELEKAIQGERTHGYLPYTLDLYGCHGSLLAKRRARNVHSKVHPYHVGAPEMSELLEWCPNVDTDEIIEDGDSEGRRARTRGIFGGRLPWDNFQGV